jgi:hypothetical protein
MGREVKLYDPDEKKESAIIMGDPILPSYLKHVEIKYSDTRARKILSNVTSVDGELAGFNPLALIELQQSGLLGEYRLANRRDVEKAIKFQLHLFNTIEVGLALRWEPSNYFYNRPISKNLVHQLKDKKITVGHNDGRLIPFSALGLRESRDSEYALMPYLLENISEKDLPSLTEFKWDRECGDGLTSAELDSRYKWDASDPSLSSSDMLRGRVLVVREDK